MKEKFNKESKLCTGITDRNGLLIYEGDYVITKHGRICQVIWLSNAGYLGFDLIPITNITDDNAPDQYDIWKSENLEIINNYKV
ncbi:hypothetical protein IKN40_05910 [bacterium]|nr:hypothetical protein [bacterium]